MKSLTATLYNIQNPKTKNQDPSEPGYVVSGSLATVLRASSAVGAAPVRVNRARAAWRVLLSPSLAILQRLLMTTINIVMVVGLGWDFYQESTMRIRAGESTLKAVIWVLDMFLVMLIANIAIYMGPSRMETLLQVLKQLQQINFDLKMKSPSVKTEKIKTIAIVCLLLWSVGIQFLDIYNLMEAAVKENKMWPIMCMYYTYYYSNIVGVVMLLQWNFAACGVNAASVELNQQLRQLRYDLFAKANLEPKPKALEDVFRGSQSVSSLVDGITALGKINTDVRLYPSHVQAAIRRLALSYDRISEVITQMNAGNGLILLVMIMSIFLRLVLTPYYLLLGLFDEDDLVVSVVVMQINWSVFHVINLMLIVEPCHWTHAERGYTGHLLSQLTVHLAPKCERISKELDQFAMQVTLNNAKFMPLGIYELARPLMATIFGGVTTYLVIIIQFQKISDLL